MINFSIHSTLTIFLICSPGNGMDFFSGISIEDPNTLQELLSDDTSMKPSPDTTVGISTSSISTPKPGLFDHFTIESPFPWFTQPVAAAVEYPSTRVGLFDGVVLDTVTTAAPGLFDNINIEDPPSGDTAPIEDTTLKNDTHSTMMPGISKHASTESYPTTHPSSATHGPTPTEVRGQLGGIEHDDSLSTTRSILDEPGTPRNYSIFLVVVVVIQCLMLLVGVLQTLILKRILLDSSQGKCLKDLEQGYMRDETVDPGIGYKEDVIVGDSTGSGSGKETN